MTVAEWILRNHRIAYALANRELKVVAVGGALDVFRDRPEVGSGCSLPDLIPELVSSEEVLTDILAGDLPRFQLEYVNRSAPDGSTRYLMVTILPHPGNHPEAALLVVVADTSEQGQYAQRIMQQRNELRLLQRNLAEAKERLDYLLRHYVPPEVANTLMSQPILPHLGGELREVSVLFADLRDYTRTTEGLSPSQTMELLNEYLGIASDAIAEAGGTITEFPGDAVIALFNAPEEQPDHPWRAVRAGLTIQQRVAVYNSQVSPGSPPLRFGVGINTGPALVGNIGARWRYHYTAIGDTVNVAWRICSAARPGEVLIGSPVYERLQGRAAITPLAPLQLKGKSHPVLVYRVEALYGENGESSPAQ